MLRVTDHQKFVSRAIVSPMLIGILTLFAEGVMPYGQTFAPSQRLADCPANVARPVLAKPGSGAGAGLADQQPVGAGEGPKPLRFKMAYWLGGSAPALPRHDGRQVCAGPAVAADKADSALSAGSSALGLAPLPHRVALKAMGGAFGPLNSWRKQGYQRLLEGKATTKLAWITHYSTGEPSVNHITASGRQVSSRVAAMNGVAFGTFVLVSLPNGHQLRQVWDRGSRRNDSRARLRGASVWCDLWMPSRTSKSYVRKIWIVQKAR